MSDYQPPLQDMMFILYDVLGFEHDDYDRDTIEAILNEASKLSIGVLAPLNKTADEEGATLINGNVKTAKGFKDAYATYCEGGWNAVPFDPEYGGQGLPWAVAFPIQEMWQGANMSFGLCPLLNQGAVEAIYSHGSEKQKDHYLPNLISGKWSGTMNITEPQAGSDLGLLRTKAEKQKDGRYKITGQKIFITYGDHDMSENIIHLVLARIVGAPDDVRGISLFVVPKIMENGEKNAVECGGLEHKLGIHASPTCTMNFDNAEGELIGEEHNGLRYMFTMMNNARLSVGLQGVAIAERSYQHAHNYANERVQGKSFADGERVVISKHADVRRMLLDMKSRIMAGRIMSYNAALELDKAICGNDGARERVDFLTPIVKSWCADMAVHVSSVGLQVHGGMGFIEETGAAQYYRDARILPIYEGTNGIQASDFIFRKVVRDDAVMAKAYINEMSESVDKIYIDALLQATERICALSANNDLDRLSWLAMPYLNAFGVIMGGAMIGGIKANVKGGESDSSLQEICGFYNSDIIPFSLGYLSPIIYGS